ncbi:MAG TPA: hypothetical protein VK957_20120 [Lunatimonas sp.]|nr:hypothetical protein [Lunatimonas sp.]
MIQFSSRNIFRYTSRLVFITLSWIFFAVNPLQGQAQATNWPDSIPWWKANNLRVIQTNLPAYEAATLDPDSLVADLIHFSANTLIINAGGIMAFYSTNLVGPY